MTKDTNLENANTVLEENIPIKRKIPTLFQRKISQYKVNFYTVLEENTSIKGLNQNQLVITEK